MWNLSLFFFLATVFDTNEKNAATFLSLFTGNVLTFLLKLYQPFFKFALTFSMLQVSSAYPQKHKNWIQKTKVKPKKNCVWLEKRIGELRVIAQTLDSAFGFWFPLKISKSQRIFWLSVWKSWSLVLKQILSLFFWSSRKNDNFWKSGL